MLVTEIMTKDVITISPDASLKDIGLIFKEKRISGIPVIDDYGNIAGIVTLTDMLRILDRIYTWKELQKKVRGSSLSDIRQEEKSKAKVKDIMTKDVFTISPNETVDYVVRIMLIKNIHTFPVIEEGKLVGIVGKRDLIYACF
jgi:CBS domain-containing protein